MIKKVIIGLLIAGGLFVGSAFVVGMIEGIKSGISGTTTVETTEEVKEQPKEEIKEESKVEEVKEELPESNTTNMVNHLIKKAAEDKENNLVSEEEALEYIKDKFNNNNIFQDNKTMENFIYYGRVLEKSENKTLSSIGTDSIQLVKYVYRGVEKINDISTQSNLEQIEKGLKQLN